MKAYNEWFVLVADDKGRQPNRAPRLSLETQRYMTGWMAENPGREVWKFGPFRTQAQARIAMKKNIDALKSMYMPINRSAA